MNITNFVERMDKFGIKCNDAFLFADGKMHRFHVNGDRLGSKNGWYVLYDGDIKAGAFGCWKRDINETWCEKETANLSLRERTEFRRTMDLARQAREDELRKRHEEAKQKAQEIWNSSHEVDSHPYLTSKKIKAYGIRQHGDCLVIPLICFSGLA